MKKAIKTNLFQSKAPLEWAIVSENTLYTAQIPIDANGDLINGGIDEQTTQCFENLKHTLECANTTLDNVLQVLIYVTDRSYLQRVNAIYAAYFNPPYPNRAAFVVSSLAREGMLVEFVVYAHTEA